jgi:hypothetical protein
MIMQINYVILSPISTVVPAYCNTSAEYNLRYLDRRLFTVNM